MLARVLDFQNALAGIVVIDEVYNVVHHDVTVDFSHLVRDEFRDGFGVFDPRVVVRESKFLVSHKATVWGKKGQEVKGFEGEDDPLRR